MSKNGTCSRDEIDKELLHLWGKLVFGMIGATVITAKTRRSPEFRRIFRAELKRLETERLRKGPFKERKKVKKCCQERDNPGAANHQQHSQRKPSFPLFSQHYAVLGLDVWRKTPYTDKEIKDAFTEKAKEYHPDRQKQENKEFGESKFKELMLSYEAIKVERGTARRT